MKATSPAAKISPTIIEAIFGESHYALIGEIEQHVIR